MSGNRQLARFASPGLVPKMSDFLPYLFATCSRLARDHAHVRRHMLLKHQGVPLLALDAQVTSLAHDGACRSFHLLPCLHFKDLLLPSLQLHFSPSSQPDTFRPRRRTQRRRKSEKRTCGNKWGDIFGQLSRREEEPPSELQRFPIFSPQALAFRHLSPSPHHHSLSVHLTVSHSFQLKPEVLHDLCQSSLVPGACVRRETLELPTHERDRTAEERISRQRRNNEAGGLGTRQNSRTRRVRNLQLSDSPATQPAPPAPKPPPLHHTRRPTQRKLRQEPLCCVVRIQLSKEPRTTASC